MLCGVLQRPQTLLLSEVQFVVVATHDIAHISRCLFTVSNFPSLFFTPKALQDLLLGRNGLPGDAIVVAVLAVVLKLRFVAQDGLEGHERVVGSGTGPETRFLNEPIEAATVLLPNAAKK